MKSRIGSGEDGEDEGSEDGEDSKSIKELKMMPILSISTNYEYADVLMPSVEDWLTNLSLNKTFVHSMNCTVKNSPVNSEWTKKKDMFLFRGHIDDCGMDISTNRKLKIVYMGMDNDNMDAKLLRTNSSSQVFNVSGPNRIIIESVPEFIQLEDGENYYRSINFIATIANACHFRNIIRINILLSVQV